MEIGGPDQTVTAFFYQWIKQFTFRIRDLFPCRASYVMASHKACLKVSMVCAFGQQVYVKRTPIIPNSICQRRHEKKRTLWLSMFVVLQMRMQSPIWATDRRYLSEDWVALCPLYMSATTKALARLRLCAVSPEPLLVAYLISILFSCDGPYHEYREIIR